MSRRNRPGSSYQLATYLAVALSLLFIFVSAAYILIIAEPDSPQSQDQIVAELASHRTTWTSRRPAAYRYVVQRDCSCPAEYLKSFIVTEQSGSKTARFPIPVESSSGAVLTEPPMPVWLDEVFGIADRAARDGNVLDIGFDPTFGYPTRLEIRRDADPQQKNERFEIRDFEILARR